MIGIIAADEAGIELPAGRAGEHPLAEGLGLGLGGFADMNVVLRTGGTGECGKGKRKDKGELHDRYRTRGWQFALPPGSVGRFAVRRGRGAPRSTFGSRS